MGQQTQQPWCVSVAQIARAGRSWLPLERAATPVHAALPVDAHRWPGKTSLNASCRPSHALTHGVHVPTASVGEAASVRTPSRFIAACNLGDITMETDA